MTAKSIALFIVAAIAEIGGAYLMWQAVKEGRGLLFAAAGAVALTGYGAVAALQPDANFGRVLAAYGGVFIVGSLLWGVAFDGFQPDRYDIACGAFAFTLIVTLAIGGVHSISILGARAGETLLGGVLGLLAAKFIFPLRL